MLLNSGHIPDAMDEVKKKNIAKLRGSPSDREFNFSTIIYIYHDGG